MFALDCLSQLSIRDAVTIRHCVGCLLILCRVLVLLHCHLEFVMHCIMYILRCDFCRIFMHSQVSAQVTLSIAASANRR